MHKRAGVISITVFSFLVISGLSVASAGEEEWGPVRNGLKTRLVPLEQSYVLGKPMRFRVEVTNVDRVAKTYNPEEVEIQSFINTGSCSTPHSHHPYPPVPTKGASQRIDPGEIKVLFDQWDIASDYVLNKPGRYTIQYEESVPWNGHRTFSPSNNVEIQVQAGEAYSDRKSTRLNSSHSAKSRMPSSA